MTEVQGKSTTQVEWEVFTPPYSALHTKGRQNSHEMENILTTNRLNHIATPIWLSLSAIHLQMTLILGTYATRIKINPIILAQIVTPLYSSLGGACVHPGLKRQKLPGWGRSKVMLCVVLTARGPGKSFWGGGKIWHIDMGVVVFIQSINTEHMGPAHHKGQRDPHICPCEVTNC